MHRSRLTTVTKENVLVSSVIVHVKSLGGIKVVQLRCVLPAWVKRRYAIHTQGWGVTVIKGNKKPAAAVHIWIAFIQCIDSKHLPMECKLITHAGTWIFTDFHVNKEEAAAETDFISSASWKCWVILLPGLSCWYLQHHLLFHSLISYIFLYSEGKLTT